MKNYIVKVLNGMAIGLFSSLIIGLILKQIGVFFNVELIINFANIVQRLMGPAIGAGVAYSLGANQLIIVSAIAAGALGAGSVSNVDGKVLLSIGEPVGALISAWISTEVAKKFIGKTKIDIVFIPTIVILLGGYVGFYLSPHIAYIMNSIGGIINFATQQQPIIMGLIISVVMGIALTLPISSAAIGISLGLNGLAAGAAVVGCCCHMVGFAVSSYRDNGFGGLISQGLGTSMLQISNIIKNPIIAVPAVLSSVILGPLATTVFSMKSSAIGSGMGTSGLVGTISTVQVMGNESLMIILLMQFVFPAIISFGVSEFLRNKKLIKMGDMKI